jgi:hypothetical protein
MAAPKRTWICPPRAGDPLRINGNTMKGRRVRHRWRLYLAKLVNPDDPLQRTFAADCANWPLLSRICRAALLPAMGRCCRPSCPDAQRAAPRRGQAAIQGQQRRAG